MTAPAEPVTTPTALPAQPLQPAGDRPGLRLVVVPTPQPPLEDERHPVRLVIPGVRPPRPPHRPGPRPRSTTPRAAADADFGPTWSVRADLPDLRQSGRRLITMTLEALAGRRPMGPAPPPAAPGV